jgi:YidC/Oxa1 family membrane protein insertase
MERRVFIAVLLSFVVLYTYQTYFAPAPPAPPAAGAKPAAARRRAGARRQCATPGASPVAVPSEPSRIGARRDAARESLVESETLRVVFTNRGARILHWQLKNYRDTAGRSSIWCPRTCRRTSRVPFTLTA